MCVSYSSCFHVVIPAATGNSTYIPPLIPQCELHVNVISFSSHASNRLFNCTVESVKMKKWLPEHNLHFGPRIKSEFAKSFLSWMELMCRSGALKPALTDLLAADTSCKQNTDTLSPYEVYIANLHTQHT